MTHTELDKYTSETVAQTVLLNATTGERVPHFAELRLRLSR